jgi:hypothetical protein
MRKWSSPGVLVGLLNVFGTLLAIVFAIYMPVIQRSLGIDYGGTFGAGYDSSIVQSPSAGTPVAPGGGTPGTPSYIVLLSGQRLSITGYQLLGNKYRLQLKGGGLLDLPSQQVLAVIP